MKSGKQKTQKPQKAQKPQNFFPSFQFWVLHQNQKSRRVKVRKKCPKFLRFPRFLSFRPGRLQWCRSWNITKIGPSHPIFWYVKEFCARKFFCLTLCLFVLGSCNLLTNQKSQSLNEACIWHDNIGSIFGPNSDGLNSTIKFYSQIAYKKFRATVFLVLFHKAYIPVLFYQANLVAGKTCFVRNNRKFQETSLWSYSFWPSTWLSVFLKLLFQSFKY